MKYLIQEAKNVADSFFDLTKAIRSRSVLSQKENELVLIGIFTAQRAIKGIHTHVERAVQNGATKDEVLSAIILALPVVGIGKVNEALEVAMQYFDNV